MDKRKREVKDKVSLKWKEIKVKDCMQSKCRRVNLFREERRFYPRCKIYLDQLCQETVA